MKTKNIFKVMLFAVMFIAFPLSVKAETTNISPTSGTGISSNPYVLKISDYGTYSVASSGGTAKYFSISYAKEGNASYSLDSGYAYKGTGSSQFESSNAVTANESVILRAAGTNSSFTLTIDYKAPTKYSTKEDAYDLSAVTTEQPVTIPAGVNRTNDMWYKLTITQASTIVFKADENDYFTFQTADGKNALTERNFYDSSDIKLDAGSSGRFKFTTLDKNVFVPTNTSDSPVADGTAKVTFYDPGTYYIIFDNINKKNTEKGFKSFLLRPYKPITDVILKSGDYADPKNISVVEANANKSLVNNIVGLLPEDCDGHIVSLDYDKTYFKRESTSLGSALTGLEFTGKFGKTAVKFVDERGQAVASYNVTNTPGTVKSISGTGSSNSASVHFYSTDSYSNADSVRIYLNSGNGYQLYKTYSSAKDSVDKLFTINGLKAGKNYNIKLTNYDAATDSESAMSPEFTIGTAPATKPVIKSVKKIKVTKNKGTLIHNSGKINEYRTYYTYYAASGKITVKKVKGATYYEYNLIGTSCPNYTSKTTANLRLIKGGEKRSSVKKTLKLRCRVQKKINSYFMAYGDWGKVKKVKIK
ncbi:MAG: hypothetical protein E7271_11715 [Lachnospiraceae bacterium]|jgi:hypothetical protein|nr:hypothetical protein [Lachnospiraceae bacterium]